MDVVIFYFFLANGLESAEAHIERNGSDLDPALFDPIDDRGRKMQTRRRRRHRSGLLREDRLVALGVRRLRATRNIGRQRNVAQSFERLVHVAFCTEAKAAQSVFAASDHLGRKFSSSEMNA